MGANDKVAATFHGYTPTTKDVRALYVLATPAHRVSIADGNAEFDRWLDQVRAEAKAEALREAADRTPVAWDFPPYASALQIRPWLRARADQYKEEQ